MAQHGAKYIILASRSGLSQPDTREMIEELAHIGINVEVRQCDVGSQTDVDLLVSECSEILPPIRGVVHGAFVSRVGYIN